MILPLVLRNKGHHAFRTTHPYDHFLRGASLRTLDKALTQNPDERFWRPETPLRVRGEIRRQEGAEELAEADFRDAIALAREMSSKTWELRAATSLARLWRDQGKHTAARDLLAPV